MSQLKPELQDIVNSASDVELKAAYAIQQHTQFINDIQPQLKQLLESESTKQISDSELKIMTDELANKFPNSKYFSQAQDNWLDINSRIENFIRFTPVLLDWEFDTLSDYEAFQNYQEHIIDMVNSDNFYKFYYDEDSNFNQSEIAIFKDAVKGNLYEFLERLATKNESSSNCADRAKFANKQLIKHFQTNEIQPLSELYPKDSLEKMNLQPDTNHPTYWSWTSVKDTSELIGIIQQHLLY